MLTQKERRHTGNGCNSLARAKYFYILLLYRSFSFIALRPQAQQALRAFARQNKGGGHALHGNCQQ